MRELWQFIFYFLGVFVGCQLKNTKLLRNASDLLWFGAIRNPNKSEANLPQFERRCE